MTAVRTNRAPYSPTINQDDDKLHEECGVFGIFDHEDAAAHTALGLHALQHRGQASAGIVSFDGTQFHAHRDMGLVGDIFSDPAVMARLKGTSAIGHNRYATTGGTVLRNVQPLFAEFDFGGFAVGHNGNLTNAASLRRDLIRRGSLFQSTTDTEVIIHLIATSSGGSIVDRVANAMRQVQGAYSLVALSTEGMMGLRDPMGIRPLALGRLGNSWLLASESCAFDIMGGEFEREVEPGELVLITKAGLTSFFPFPLNQHRLCVFEYIYFARPDSTVEGIGVYEARKRIGAELARESHVPSDVIVPVPDSGVPAALGYAAEAKLPFELGIIRNHYVGRTFIEPSDDIRHLGVKLKHNANRQQLDGKRVILVDDSIVRGTTSRKIVEMVRAAGAREVHMRISSPPTTHSCFYGIDTPQREQLIASNHSAEEIARMIGVDTLAFISLDGLYRAMGKKIEGKPSQKFCDACFTGDYPVPLVDCGEGIAPRQLSLLTEAS